MQKWTICLEKTLHFGFLCFKLGAKREWWLSGERSTARFLRSWSTPSCCLTSGRFELLLGKWENLATASHAINSLSLEDGFASQKYTLEIKVWKLLVIAFRYITSRGLRTLCKWHRHNGNLKGTSQPTDWRLVGAWAVRFPNCQLCWRCFRT